MPHRTMPRFGSLEIATGQLTTQKSPPSLRLMVGSPIQAQTGYTKIDSVVLNDTQSVRAISSQTVEALAPEHWSTKLQPVLSFLLGEQGELHPNNLKVEGIPRRFMMGRHAGKNIVQVFKEIHPLLFQAIQQGLVELQKEATGLRIRLK